VVSRKRGRPKGDPVYDDRRYFVGDRDVSLGITQQNPAINLNTVDFSITFWIAEVRFKWYREKD